MKTSHKGVRYTQDGQTAILNYNQRVRGSAYQKVIKHLLHMYDAGYHRIHINISTQCEAIYNDYANELVLFKKWFPMVTVTIEQVSL